MMTLFYHPLFPAAEVRVVLRTAWLLEEMTRVSRYFPLRMCEKGVKQLQVWEIFPPSERMDNNERFGGNSSRNTLGMLHGTRIES